MRLLRRHFVPPRNDGSRSSRRGLNPVYCCVRLRNDRRGFTFMELLIALTIFAIIASSVYYALGAGIRVYRRGDAVIGDNQKLRVFFDTVSSNLRNAVLYSDEKNNFDIKPGWSPDKISFPAIINVFDEEKMRGEIARVSFYTAKKGSEGKKFLMSRAGVKEGFSEEYAEEEILLEDLEDFMLEDVTFKYCWKVTGFEDEYDWREGEEFKERLPRGIKLELTLKNKARKKTEIFEGTVFVPMGSLGDDTK